MIGATFENGDAPAAFLAAQSRVGFKSPLAGYLC